jgi:hypothetical protein
VPEEYYGHQDMISVDGDSQLDENDGFFNHDDRPSEDEDVLLSLDIQTSPQRVFGRQETIKEEQEDSSSQITSGLLTRNQSIIKN